MICPTCGKAMLTERPHRHQLGGGREMSRPTSRLKRVSDRVYLVFMPGFVGPVGTLWWNRGAWQSEYGQKVKRFQYREDGRAWIVKQAGAEPISAPGLSVHR